MRRAWIGAVILWMLGGVAWAAVSPDESYPYGSAAFHRFVEDSYLAAGIGSPAQFHRWMDRVGPGQGRPIQPTRSIAWMDYLDALRARRGRSSTPRARAFAERTDASDLHRWLKKAIPRFSLDRGYEFTSVVDRGERQCLLQSVLLASLLQRSGVDSGAVMVYRSGEGAESNLGHVVTLVKLSNGRDILSDASHKEPYVRQKGLYVWVTGGGYRFVEPIFAPGSPEITSYRLTDTGRTIKVKEVRGLNIAFLRSQLSHYRGERTIGGILFARPTSHGLSVQARWLRASVALCPANPLAVYMLGRVALKQGRNVEAYSLLSHAYRLYQRAGWIPPGPREALQQARAVYGKSAGKRS